MPDFWRNSGYHLLERDAAGRLRVTDDFLRAYFLRPEVHPVDESNDAERALHTRLMAEPRRTVAEAELAAIDDADTRDNYRLVLRFRERLLAAGTVEGCYQRLFAGTVDVPPLFIAHMVHVVLRHVLDGCEDPLALRAAELFFREQKLSVRDGHALLADLETVERHASGNRYGSIGRLIVEAQGEPVGMDLDVLDRGNAALYWERESRYDTVISLSYGQPALDALARVIEAWIRHFLGLAVAARPIRAIEEPRWAWHVGLDAEATAILNAIWAGDALEPGRLQRIVALFALAFAEPGAVRRELAGRSVYLALAADEAGIVRLKPQNLLLNLPLNEA